MSNLKEYVVVTDRPAEFMIWAKVHWETYERLKTGASESEKEIMTCRAVATFNADQSLTEDKELETLKAENSKMRKALEDGWVRVDDRLPGFKEPTRIPRAGQYPFVVIDVIDHNQYLVYTTCEVFELANFEKDGTWSFNNAEDEKVTHWRPLPALPIATEALITP